LEWTDDPILRETAGLLPGEENAANKIMQTIAP